MVPLTGIIYPCFFAALDAEAKTSKKDLTALASSSTQALNASAQKRRTGFSPSVHARML